MAPVTRTSGSPAGLGQVAIEVVLSNQCDHDMRGNTRVKRGETAPEGRDTFLAQHLSIQHHGSHHIKSHHVRSVRAGWVGLHWSSMLYDDPHPDDDVTLPIWTYLTDAIHGGLVRHHAIGIGLLFLQTSLDKVARQGEKGRQETLGRKRCGGAQPSMHRAC